MTARLRRAEWPAIFAVWAVVLQLVVVSIHIGAQSRLLGDEAFAPGFVLHCLNPGLNSGAPGPDGGSSPDGGACPACASAACQASLATSVAPVAPAPPPVARARLQAPSPATPPRPLARTGSARGPPFSLAS